MTDPGDAEHDPQRGVVSYAQRGQRMTRGQRRTWDRLWPHYGADAADVSAGPLDTAAWFGRTAGLVVEIGSGMGETTATMAAALPELNHLAVEVYTPGLAQLLMRIETAGLDNLRLLRGDAVPVLQDHIQPASVRGVRVLFPDPWPKRKHHKRRLITPGFVALAASRLEPGATLHLATDWADYAEQMLAVCAAEPRLVNAAGTGYAARPEWRPATKFEQRAHSEGRDVRDLIFYRRADRS